MHPTQISAARWAALRALHERQTPTIALLAAAADVTEQECALALQVFNKLDAEANIGEAGSRRADRIAQPAANSEAGAPSAGADTAEAGRAARVSGLLLQHADQLIAQTERQGGVLTKPQLDTMLAMVRLAEKFEPMAEQEAAQLQRKSDAELADILKRIDDRIVELAHDYARELVAGGAG